MQKERMHIMPDYKEMYLHMMRETEKAIRILIDAQRECENLYLESKEPNLKILPGSIPFKNE